MVSAHVQDPQRGNGVELKLEPLPAQSVWLIESALDAQAKLRAPTSPGVAAAPEPIEHHTTGPTIGGPSGGEDVIAAERELVSALDAEAESLKKLNPFLVLGVGYETTDEAVRMAFGELTKRYHPDRFARYQSPRLREVAAEIFILIRDAYRKLGDAAGRTQALAALGRGNPTIARTSTPVRGVVTTVKRAETRPIGSVAAPARAPTPPPLPGNMGDPHTTPTAHGVDAHAKPTAQAVTAKLPPEAIPQPHLDRKSGPVRAVQDFKSGPIRVPVKRAPTPPPVDSRADLERAATELTTPPPSGTGEPGGDVSAIDALLDAGRLDDALNQCRVMARKHPNERVFRAGIELCEGLRALAARDRLEAAQRFEAALEIDPSNERAARELAEMRRQATSERKGLLSRLMGKKEPPT